MAMVAAVKKMMHKKGANALFFVNENEKCYKLTQSSESYLHL